MIPILSLLAMTLSAQQSEIAPSRLAMPVDWDALAPLPLRQPAQVTPAMTNFVAHELRASRCRMPRRASGGYTVQVDVAVLLAPDGMVRATIPRAIDCPSVEQYTAGLVTSFARNNLTIIDGGTAGWYRATITFAWKA